MDEKRRFFAPEDRDLFLSGHDIVEEHRELMNQAAFWTVIILFAVTTIVVAAFGLIVGAQ